MKRRALSQEAKMDCPITDSLLKNPRIRLVRALDECLRPMREMLNSEEALLAIAVELVDIRGNVIT